MTLCLSAKRRRRMPRRPGPRTPRGALGELAYELRVAKPRLVRIPKGYWQEAKACADSRHGDFPHNEGRDNGHRRGTSGRVRRRSPGRRSGAPRARCIRVDHVHAERPQRELHPRHRLVGLALFYGGLVQITAGMWEFRNRNAFGSTAFSTYAGFWLSLGIFVILIETTKLGGALQGNDVANGLAWFLLSFAIFNTYMMLWSLRINLAVFGVFLGRPRSPRSCSPSGSGSPLLAASLLPGSTSAGSAPAAGRGL
jgi:hypothetical protein